MARAKADWEHGLSIPSTSLPRVPRCILAQSTNARRAYRISAQRQLNLPDEAARVGAQQASEQLERGSDMAPSSGSRVPGPDPAVGVLDDFRLLLNALFAQRAGNRPRIRQSGPYLRTGRLLGNLQPPLIPLLPPAVTTGCVRSLRPQHDGG